MTALLEAFQIASVRPPTENFSLAIPVHFYCPWGRCAFCPSMLFTESKKFSRRTLEEVFNDISNAVILNEMLLKSGTITQSTIRELLSEYPHLSDCIIHLMYWHLYTNASTAFLGGANPFLYPSDFLTKILRGLKQTFPAIARITSYGRTKSASKKERRYFKELHEAGLGRIHVGLESGSDNVLKFVNKGVTANDHLIGGQKIKDGDISLCTYVMPGLGGKKWSTEHALETARVITELEPDFVRLRTLEIFPVTPLHDKRKSGEFIELSEEEVVREERLFVENIECKTTITSDSAANLLIEIWGDMPRDKTKILKAIDDYLAITPEEKLEFSLKRRVEAYTSQYGGLSQPIQNKLNRIQKMSTKGKKYYESIKKLIRYIRGRLIP